jgi:hypothetical protein
MKILIPELQTRNVLDAVRSLGRAGHSILLAIPCKECKQASSLRCGSRYLNKTRNVLSIHVKAIFSILERQHILRC